MPRTGTLLESAISYYSNVAQQSMAAMRETQEELRTGQFEISRTVARGASLWLDALEGWWSALLVTASQPTPTVFFHVGENTTTDTQEVPAHVPADPEFTGLVPVQGSGTPPGMTVNRKTHQNALEFKLRGIDRTKMSPGLFIGLVHLGNQPLVTVMVKVDPPKTPPGSKQTP
jgi:hypothetical protein